ncbi:MAG: hypothetical protein ICV81_06775 [Flavisolibacter sp.]|nr:hypothetical protein [Flavisolibacter sp.]
MYDKNKSEFPEIFLLPAVLLFFVKTESMQVVVLSDAALRQEWISNGAGNDSAVVWIEEVQQLHQHTTADAFIDLLFLPEEQRITALQQLLPKPVIINSVIHTLSEIHSSFIRINGWPTFLQSSLIEASCLDEAKKEEAEKAMALFNKKPEWLPDESGFVTPRVISMIINEAFFAWAEGVSSPDEIDTAMKLGTAYPYGPFEWSKKIGLHNIVALLNRLSKEQQRYTPCERLVQEANRTTIL